MTTEQSSAVDQLVHLALEHDTDGIVACLRAQQSALDAATACDEAVRKLYWDHKHAAASCLAARIGIEFALEQANALPDDQKRRLLEAVKTLAYNAGSFAWPGWEEPGIEVPPSVQAAGFEAARLNLYLARELQRGDLACSRACWLLGAHELAARKTSEAEAAFAEAAALARKAGEPGEASLFDAYACIAALSADPKRQGTRAQLESLKEQLKSAKDGELFVAQIETAARLYAGPSPG